MSTLLTFPGRFGDLLWSLPSIRALSEQRGVPLDLAIGGEFASIAPLLELQPYIKSVIPLPQWSLTPPDEWKAPIELKGTDWDECIDLGYRGWPELPLPYEIARQAKVEIDLSRPWITVTLGAPPTEIAVGFTEAWFELKLGLLWAAVESLYVPYLLLTVPRSRWMLEAQMIARHTSDWVETAGIIRNSDLFFGDCSALHVLAVALGKPVVICEPMEARHNGIFYPLGMNGPQVTVVKGNDGKPTFDARACAVAIEQALGVKR